MPRRDRVGLVPDADTGVAGAALTSAMTPSRASQAAAIGNMTIPQIAEGIAIAVLSRTVSATAMANVLLWMPISKPLARTRSPARRGTAYPYVSRTPIPPPSDLRVAGSREGVDAVGGQAEGDEGEQPLPEGLLLQGAHRAVEAAGLATVLVPGREDEESAHDQ